MGEEGWPVGKAAGQVFGESEAGGVRVRPTSACGTVWVGWGGVEVGGWVGRFILCE